MAKEINLIWLTGDKTWERDWICELLSKTDVSIREILDWNYETVLDHSLIVMSFPNRDKYKDYYQAFRDKNYKFAIIHLSDEGYEHPCDFYEGAQFVLRNYWHAKFSSQKNIHFFPLGYKSEFWKNYPSCKAILPVNERRYSWCFAGQIKKTTREAMYAAMQKIPSNYVYEIPHFGAPSMLSAEDYRDVLQQSIFAPCPKGFSNLDTFRLSEALECGCIPIVEKLPFDYFREFFGDYPFLAIEQWESAPRIISIFLEHPQYLEDLQRRCYAWWMDYKDNLKTKIAHLVDELASDHGADL